MENSKIRKISSRISRVEMILTLLDLMADPIWNQSLIIIKKQELKLTEKEFESLAKIKTGEISVEDILPAGLKTFEQRSLARRSMFKRVSPNSQIRDWERKYRNMATNASMFR